jgi:ribonuclease D
VKGARDLPLRSLAALRELYELRESLALAADRPPFKILSEEILFELAKTLPADSQALATIKGVTPRVMGRWGGVLLAALERAQSVDEATLPQWPRRPRPSIPGAVSRRVEALRKWRTAATERIGLEPGVLLPNRLISVIAEAAPRSIEALAAVDGVRRWRAEQFGGELIAALERS